MDASQPISVVETGPRTLKLDGDLDLASIATVQRYLERLDGGDIVVDCSGLTFVDASGLGLLVRAHLDCEGRGVRLLLVDPPRCMTRLLAITELDSLLNVQFDNVQFDGTRV